MCSCVMYIACQVKDVADKQAWGILCKEIGDINKQRFETNNQLWHDDHNAKYDHCVCSKIGELLR